MSIDYGNGLVNLDKSNGIRYGVISVHDLNYDAFDSMKKDVYGGPNCPKCGNDAVEYNEDKHGEYEPARTHGCCADYACEDCETYLDSDMMWGEEVIGYESSDPDYVIDTCLDTDVCILQSPYYTFAEFCSPCVPGAGNLNRYNLDGVKTYCFSHEMFETRIAPYPVYEVADDSIVESTRDIEDAIAVMNRLKFEAAAEQGIEPGPAMVAFSESDNPICRVLRFLHTQL